MKLTNRQKHWLKIDAAIQGFKPGELRRFFSAAAKFLIPPKHWDDQAPVSEFDYETVIQEFHRGFTQFQRAEMEFGGKPGTQDDEVLLRLLRLASNCGDKKLSRKRAKRKLKKLRESLQTRFKKYVSDEDQPLRGLRYYESLLRGTFLAKEATGEKRKKKRRKQRIKK